MSYFLNHFFSSYFHQDWVSNAESADEVLEAFIRSEPRSHLSGCLDELVLLQAQNKSDDELQVYLEKELGCCYIPEADGITPSQWLNHIARRLREALS